MRDISLDVCVPSNVDSPLLKRLGNKLTHCLQALFAARKVIILGIICLIGFVEPAFAQSLLEGDATKPVTAVQRLVQVALWVAIGGAGIFTVWAGFNKGNGKAFGNQLIGACICAGASGLFAFINATVNGDGVDLPDL